MSMHGETLSGHEDSRRLQPITVRIPEACRITGIGRSKLYELIGAGEIETLKVGAITLLPLASIEAFLSRQIRR